MYIFVAIFNIKAIILIFYYIEPNYIAHGSFMKQNDIEKVLYRRQKVLFFIFEVVSYHFPESFVDSK